MARAAVDREPQIGQAQRVLRHSTPELTASIYTALDGGDSANAMEQAAPVSLPAKADAHDAYTDATDASNRRLPMNRKTLVWIVQQEDKHGTTLEKCGRMVAGAFAMLAVLGIVGEMIGQEPSGFSFGLLLLGSLLLWNQLFARAQRRAHLYMLLRAMGKVADDDNVAS